MPIALHRARTKLKLCASRTPLLGKAFKHMRSCLRGSSSCAPAHREAGLCSCVRRRRSAVCCHANKPNVDWDEEFKRLKQRRPDLSGSQGEVATTQWGCACWREWLAKLSLLADRKQHDQRFFKPPQPLQRSRPDPSQEQETGLVDFWSSSEFFVGGAAVVLILMVVYLLAALEM